MVLLEGDREKAEITESHFFDCWWALFGMRTITAPRGNDQERVTVYTNHRLTLATSTSDGGLRILDARRDGGREGEVVLHGGGGAAATQGELRHLHPLGDSPRRSLIAGRLLHFLRVYCLLELDMLCDCVTRGYGDHSPLTRPKEGVTHGGRCQRGAVCRWLGGGGSRGGLRGSRRARVLRGAPTHS